MSENDWQSIWLTIWTAAVSVLLILPPGLAVAWLLAKRQWRGKPVLETLVSLPLVLPPVATGLILLKLLGRKGPLGGFFENTLGIEIIFTWKAVVIALSVMAFPLFVRSARTAFEEVPARLEGIARTLGASPWRAFWTVTLPLARRGIAAGMVLAFARALGEFGATVMIAGFIPGETATITLSIYQSFQIGDDDHATRLVIVSVVMAFIALAISEVLSRHKHSA